MQYSFTWGDNIYGCDKSKYTFDPITKSPVSKVVKEQKNLILYFSFRSFNLWLFTNDSIGGYYAKPNHTVDNIDNFFMQYSI